MKLPNITKWSWKVANYCKRTIEDKNGEIICRVYASYTSVSEDWENPYSEAIAAVPDLLQAAVDLLKCPLIKEQLDGKICVESTLTLYKLRRALIKAGCTE